MSIAISGSSITFPDQTQMSTAVGGSFRNRIINGDMRIWQRGTSVSNPTTSAFYTADRWGCNRTGDATGAVVSRIASGLTGFEYALSLQRVAGNANTASLSLWYSNESTNTYDLAGSPATLSFWAKTGVNHSGGGSLAVIIYSGTGTDQRVYAYTGLVTVASMNQSITSTWARYTLTGTVPANSTELGLQISWTPTGTAGADDSVYITGVQLEQGSAATDFERRPIGVELALCQRYYQGPRVYSGTIRYNSASAVSGVFAQGSLPISPEMRSAPTVTISNNTGAGTPIINPPSYSHTVNFGSSTTATNGSPVDFNYVLSAEL